MPSLGATFEKFGLRFSSSGISEINTSFGFGHCNWLLKNFQPTTLAEYSNQDRIIVELFW